MFRNLSYGMWNTPVMILQKNLTLLGYGQLNPIGLFGPKTRDAVKAFQGKNGLQVTGVYGQKEDLQLQKELSGINRRKMYFTALAFIGKDSSPNDLASDEYGCADSVCGVIFTAFPKDPGINWTVSTYTLLQELMYSGKYARVDNPLPGDIVLNATGTSSIRNTPIRNGHTGVLGENNLIMSNNSDLGIWDTHYTLDSWNTRYVKQGGYKTYFFRRL